MSRLVPIAESLSLFRALLIAKSSMSDIGTLATSIYSALISGKGEWQTLDCFEEWRSLLD
jgi:hypothetical protein